MTPWLWCAGLAAVLYGLHQVFTKLASGHIGSGVGASVVEASATATILLYLTYSKLAGHWVQPWSSRGLIWSVVTGVCVGAGTIVFFVMFQRGGPLSAVPAVLAVGAALMAAVGMVIFREPPSLARVVGVLLSLAGLYLIGK
ncbi:MAG TPA: EamA family transporter [Candidatus Cryosericum sp.]|nr:EamA family transporter [Candidatus Cryosericum sp.]